MSIMSKFCIFIILLCLVLCFLFITDIKIENRLFSIDIKVSKIYKCNNYTNASNFDNFDNVVGTKNGCYIVPNYVHFLRFNKVKLSFPEAVCILAAFKHQKPDKIFIHTNVKPIGKYWNVTLTEPGIEDVIVFKHVDLPTEIFGQKLNPGWKVFHGGDVTRLRILMKYGGVFLDNDSYIVRNLNDYRRYEMAIGWQRGKSLQNQVIVAHKDARFLKLWLESYRNNYKPGKWYYNAGQFPTKILENATFLVHSVPKFFGGYGVVREVFEKKWPGWRYYYAIHLMMNHQYLLKSVNENATYPVEFDDTNIHKYPVAFRDMVYDVYNFKEQNTLLSNRKRK